MSKEQRDRYIKRIREVRRERAKNRIAIVVFAIIIIIPIALEILKWLAR